MTPDQELQSCRLMVLAQQGDQRAYEELLQLLARDARGYVGRRVGWADWVEDIVQDVLLTVHRARHTYDGARAFAPWFYAIVNSRLIDALRVQRRRAGREVVDEEALAREATPAAAAGGGEMREELARAVSNLPRVQREVVSLLKYDDLSVREVAGRLGMSEAAVKATAHRGYKVLRKTVRGAGVEDRRAD